MVPMYRGEGFLAASLHTAAWKLGRQDTMSANAWKSSSSGTPVKLAARAEAAVDMVLSVLKYENSCRHSLAEARHVFDVIVFLAVQKVCLQKPWLTKS